MSEKRDNSGALFRNDRKNKDNHPDHTGVATIDGVEYYVSAWVKESANGRFFSMAYTRKDKQGGGGQRPATQQQMKENGLDDWDDDVPF